MLSLLSKQVRRYLSSTRSPLININFEAYMNSNRLLKSLTFLMLSFTVTNAIADTVASSDVSSISSDYKFSDNYVTGQLVALRSVIISNEVTGVVDEY